MSIVRNPSGPVYRRIGRPLEGLNVPTPQDYITLARIRLGRMRELRPALAWPEVHVADTCPQEPPQIRQGRWLVGCACGNWPHYDPEWRMAVCIECGAIYSHVDPPDRWQDAEVVLMRRSDFVTRNWMPGESVESLQAENAAHGVGA